MSAKTSKKPVIGVLTGTFISGGAADFSTSPRTQSPRGLNFDSGAVGLGIVAALEKSAGGGSDVPALFGRNFSRSSPIPVKNSSTNRRDSEEMELDLSLEEYTIVTRHGQDKSYTKVYSDAAEVGRKGDDRAPFRIQSTGRATVFHISPPRFGDATASPPPSDFLSACDLCRKKLHGKDIFMYRGEKAFCSSECRYRQIVVDERKEKCSAEASRPAAAAEVAGSPYSNEQLITTGILAI